VKRPGFLSNIWAGAISLVLCNAYMADETVQFIIITSTWQAFEEEGIQIGFWK